MGALRFAFAPAWKRCRRQLVLVAALPLLLFVVCWESNCAIASPMLAISGMEHRPNPSQPAGPSCTADSECPCFQGISQLRTLGLTLALAIGYWLCMVVVRWNRIACPTRELLATQMRALRSEIDSLGALPQLAPISGLITDAENLIDSRKLPRGTRVADMMFWSRGKELAGWGYIHEAEIHLAAFLGAETVRARLEAAELPLRGSHEVSAISLANEIHNTPFEASTLSRQRALLSQALSINYQREDTSFTELVTWQNKTSWLVFMGLLLIVTLAGIEPARAIFFLVGALGGLLSRLSRSLERKAVPTDYGASWTTLFLSPVAGALGAWTGILVTGLAATFNVLSTGTFSGLWACPFGEKTLAVALIFGFSERLLDTVLDKVISKAGDDSGSGAVQKPTASPTTPNPSGSPTSRDPTGVPRAPSVISQAAHPTSRSTIMSKTIVFCADGTWNGPGEADHDSQDSPASNVFKLFANLDGVESLDSLQLAKEQEKVSRGTSGSVRQVAKYIHGVGDSTNILDKLLGGAAGAGLITRIVRGYTFISRNYANDDAIILVGFSRGAYTARALAGLIAARGLLDGSSVDLEDKESAYRAGCAVWYDYRKAALANDPVGLGKLEETILDLPAFISRPRLPALIPGVRIRCVAVWDTVGALGIPEYNREKFRIDAFRFCDTRLSRLVDRGLHAVSIDERRADFTPTLWDTDTRITQVLFPGAHADVGGGYPIANKESGLSNGALAWMTDELTRLGLLFTAPLAVQIQPDALAPAHQPWIKPPWDGLPRLPEGRVFPTGLLLHRSVLERISGGDVMADPSATPAPYAPPNLGSYVARAQTLPGVQIV